VEWALWSYAVFLYTIMAENKKSFVAYCEWIETFEALSDEDAGALVKHLFKYVNDQNPTTENEIVKLCFIPIKQSLKRDLKKYESYIEKQKANGKKGGRPKTQKTQRFISKPKKADSVNVNVNDITTLYGKFVDEVLKGEHSQAVEQMYMRLKLKPGALTPLLKNFQGQLIINNNLHKNTLDFRKHFNNYLNLQESKGLLKQYKI